MKVTCYFLKLHQGLTIWLFLQRKKIIYPIVQKFGVSFILLYQDCIYLIKYAVKQFKHFFYLNIFYNLIHHAKVEFSVTWWFCDQETFLLLLSTLKTVALLNIFMETMIFFILWVESSEEQHLFEKSSVTY